MGADSKIEWTTHTFNPWWGCARVSPACDHCYAEALAHRYGHDVWGKGGERRFFGDKHWNEPLKWDRDAQAQGVRPRVFCASMADVFEDHPDLDGQRQRLWEIIYQTPNLDWLLLTKRPENVARMVPTAWTDRHDTYTWFGHRPVDSYTEWPLNAWVGTTVENQRYANIRIPRLLALPAPVHFLSCEPLLGSVDLTEWLGGLEWVIAGGESGPGARPMDPTWARQLRDQCNTAAVPFLFKQWGEHDATGRKVGKKNAGRELDGRTWDQLPGDIPEELHV